MKIARVFPTQTSMSPQDRHAYFGPPGLFTPQYDEVHISVTFTWDLDYAVLLRRQWQGHAPCVRIGGPAISGEGKEFVPGMYVREGVTITSRGCPRSCPWCFVDEPLQELEIHPGNNIIDNNILACSDSHIDKVFEMLRSQRRIKFSGGLEAGRVTEKIAERLRALSLRSMYLAYDNEDAFATVKKAFQILSRYFSRDQLSCYVLIGFDDDTMERAERRLYQILEIGGLPFAMLYRNKAGEYPQPEMAWKKFQKFWVRPAYVRFKLKEMRAQL